jgi:isochorismate hydrolase
MLQTGDSPANAISKSYRGFESLSLRHAVWSAEKSSGAGIFYVIFAGINTHACIRVSAIDAYQQDWEIILAADCVGSYDREHHDISLKYMKDKIASVMISQEIRSVFSAN